MPLFGFGRYDNDYGQGFYCTEDIELAKEWACKGQRDGYVNVYSLDMQNLRILDLDSDDYGTLHWIALLMANRFVDLETDEDIDDVEWLIQNYAVDLSKYDVITGYRADDSYFSYARDFAAGTITLTQLERALVLGELGKQIVLKSRKAFSSLSYKESLPVNKTPYFEKWKQRDTVARSTYKRSIRRQRDNGPYLWEIRRDQL